MKTGHIKSGSIFTIILAALLVTGLAENGEAAEATTSPSVSLTLTPVKETYDINEAVRGAVRFHATIRNDGSDTITVAHPSICVPADYEPGETMRFSDRDGKSEIVFTAIRPDGEKVVLRYGFLIGFEPGNARILTIPSNETGAFDLGWFFQNALGRWDRNDEAARLFTQKGRYRIVLLFRNYFPMALLYDVETRETEFVYVWTGEMKSEQITVDIK